jgi:hypothetical protein
MTSDGLGELFVRDFADMCAAGVDGRSKDLHWAVCNFMIIYFAQFRLLLFKSNFQKFKEQARALFFSCRLNIVTTITGEISYSFFLSFFLSSH